MFAGVNGTKTNKFSYGPGGRVVSQTYADNTTASNGTVATFEYDERALPKTVKWVRSGQAPKTVAT